MVVTFILYDIEYYHYKYICITQVWTLETQSLKGQKMPEVKKESYAHAKTFRVINFVQRQKVHK